MALYRQIYTTFWSDPKIDDDFTPEDKYFYLYLLTNPHTNICGCYEISMKQLTRELGYNEDVVKTLIRRMEENHGVLKYNQATKEVLLLNWHKYNWSKSPAVVRGVRELVPYIKCEEFRQYVLDKLSEDSGDGIGTVYRPSPDGIETSVSVSVSDSVSDNIEIGESEGEGNKDCGKGSVAKDIQTAVDYWNKTELQKVARMTASSIRGKMMGARIQEYGLESVLRAIDNAASSVYLKGEPWFAIDWFVRPNNFVKVLEGKYNGTRAKKSSYSEMLKEKMADGRDRRT